MKRIQWVFLLLAWFNGITAPDVKQLKSLKVAQAPTVDGKLDDAAWLNAEIATDFIVHQPTFGAAALQNTTVKVIYTNDAIFIGAHLKDDPAKIRRQLTSRDGERMQDTDVFGVVFDTYHDGQNAFQFNVTAANVQSDMRISAATTNSDYNWDAVWSSRVAIVEDGWIVEIKIPYMAIRFSEQAIQDWGVNFYRFIRRTNESSYWNPVNPQVGGYVNQFGTMLELRNLKPPLRLSFLPYISGGHSSIPTATGNKNNVLTNGGLDVKYGINESFTLDMTLVPDFGQVLSDNVVLNLSPFEVQFIENRPFFTEGTELFNKSGIFYSRRVGATPSGYYSAKAFAAQNNYEIISNPSITQLYNASKFSGRNRQNLGIGVFNAITAPMHARLRSKQGDIINMETEPLTNYNIIVIDQALKNRSYITYTNSNVVRSGTARDAQVSALDVSLYDKKNTFNFLSKTRFSHVTGSNPHNGFASYMGVSKISGAWQWGLFNNIESEKYDINDLGLLRAPNEVSFVGSVTYQQFAPNKHFNYRNYRLRVVQNNLIKPFKYSSIEYNGNFLHVFKNFWDVSLNISGQPLWNHDYFEMRTKGVMVKKSRWWYFGFGGSTDSRKKLLVSYTAGYAESPIPNDPFFNTILGVRYRFNTRFSLDVSYQREDDKGNFGYAFREIDGTPVLGRRKVLNATGIIKGVYNFTSRMNITFRARHYWSKVDYVTFFHVDKDGGWLEQPFVAGYNQNFNVFNLDAFFTWDFRLGSRIIVAWKNALGPEESIDGIRYKNYSSNLLQALQGRQSKELTFRFVYFLDYNQLKGKKLGKV